MSDEIKDILAETTRELQKWPISDLVGLIDRPHTRDVAGRTGRFQIEAQALWDDRERKVLRVLVSVDDGGLRSIAPRTESFLISTTAD